MCEFYGSNGNGFGDIWWTDNPIYFSSIDVFVAAVYRQCLSYKFERGYSQSCSANSGQEPDFLIRRAAIKLTFIGDLRTNMLVCAGVYSRNVDPLRITY